MLYYVVVGLMSLSGVICGYMGEISDISWIYMMDYEVTEGLRGL